MPYPNEHACRLVNPNNFKPDSFRRMERKHKDKGYSVIVGRLKGEDTTTEQAYRYDKEIWTETAAKSHCQDHDGSFEAAAETKETMTEQEVKQYSEMNISELQNEYEKFDKELNKKLTSATRNEPEILELKRKTRAISEMLNNLYLFKFSEAQYISLKESAEMLDTKEDDIARELKENHRIRVVLMKSGIGKTPTTIVSNKRLKPYYTPDFIASITNIFDNVKMFMNHETEAEKKQGERDITRWISTAVSPEVKVTKDNSTAIIGWAIIHDAEFESRLTHKSFRDAVGTSVNAYGRGYINKIGDENVFQASTLEKVYSVDWTPEANFSAGVFRETKLIERSNKMDDIKTLKIEDLKTFRPDLVDVIIQETTAALPSLTVASLKENYPGLVKEIENSVAKGKDDVATEQNEKIQRLQIKNVLGIINLPDQAKVRITDSIMKKIYTDENELNVALTEAVKIERDYIGEIAKTGKIKAYTYQSGGSVVDQIRTVLQHKLGTYKEPPQT